MDRIFCLSDTFDSNKKMLENLDIRPEDILSPNDPDAIDKIVAQIDKERDDLLEYREKVKRWKSFNKKLDINNLEYITADLNVFGNKNSRNLLGSHHIPTDYQRSSLGILSFVLLTFDLRYSLAR
jgi:hypothetical protein